MKILYTISITILFCISCSLNNQNNSNTKEKQTNMKIINISNENSRKDSIIKEYILKFNSPEDWGSDYYFMTREELDLEFTLIYEYLQRKNFKFPEESLLNKVKKDLLYSNKNNKGFIVNHDDYKTILSPKSPIKIENESYINNEYHFKDLFDLEVYANFNLFINYKYKFITDLIPLAYIIDSDSDSIKIEMLPYIEYFNNYIFYGNQSSLTWLKINNPNILYNLFDSYGYTQDKKLNQWILEGRLNNNAVYDFGKAFYYKRFDNTVKFNYEVFEIFEEKVNSEYMKQLKHLFTSPNIDDEYDLTFEQKAELFARLMYLGEDVAYKNQTVKIVTKDYPYYPDSFRQYIGSFTGDFQQYIDEDGKYYEEFKRNNFYNLPDFEDYWQAGQDYIEMMTPPQKEIEEG